MKPFNWDDPQLADDVIGVFSEWVRETRGIDLYPAQEEAALELAVGNNVILATPTGTGKSLVALAAHVIALAEGRRTVYTAPIKALVSEKFFELVATFGPEKVGMITGDGAINADAPIICCTAEILANIALRDADAWGITQVVMDEFHFYAEPDRGWAWQVPLLIMPNAQFLLMSATLGDMTDLQEDLSERTGRETAHVTSAVRPVPLSFRYETSSIHESVEKVLGDRETPVYIVHFAQAQAVETAQALASMKLVTREERDEIAEHLGAFRFSAGFGQTLSRLIRGGIGVHHAGMLPKYRRLVETLAQKGLLRVICGTDTLGVGINVPIRSVMFTALTKFDGVKMRLLSAREFHQIAGRAGRAGFDTEGDVIILAPEHEVENAKAVAKAEAKAAKGGKAAKKPAKKSAPQGFVTWNEASMERLVAKEPEALVSRMRVSHSMVLAIIGREEQREGEALETMQTLIFGSHEPKAKQFAHARTALQILRTLRQGGVVTLEQGPGGQNLLRLTVELQDGFALNQPLSPFALAAIELLDEAAPDYALDVISMIEATLEDPRQILREQEHRARGEAVAEMKAEGIEYDERMEKLEEITYPKPLEELLTAAFEEYAAEVPWARDYELRPKSVVRDMIERAFGFRDMVSAYGLGRAEGGVLRYLSDAFRALSQTVPDEKKTEELDDLIDWLGELVRQVDSSLIDEWERLQNPEAVLEAADSVGDVESLAPPVRSIVHNTRAFTMMVRNALFMRVQHSAFDRVRELGQLDGPHGFSEQQWDEALERYYNDYESISVDGEARSPKYCVIDTSRAAEGTWQFRQVLSDPEQNHDWAIMGEVDLRESEEQGEAVIRVQRVGEI
ncbi:DEAD/DEAH box helicase [Leucobacter chinensis]|uniref:DEAD/DEAH box helicase n=1 Tax=Leucobacter chinensis TaxID=2851010 RepID=UPI001C20F75D